MYVLMLGISSGVSWYINFFSYEKYAIKILSSEKDLDLLINRISSYF